MRRLEVLDNQREQYAKAKKEKFSSVFKKHEGCRWSYWKNMNAEDMLKHVVTIVFPFIQNLDGDEDTLYSKYMKGATFMIQKPSLLQEAVSIFDELNITNQNQDTQGDIYEYLLSKLSIAGQNGQFRTPRHIIRMIIELVNPQLGESICDPACGTGGFLVNSYEHIVKNNTSKDLIEIDSDGTPHNLIGDKITKKEHWDLLKNKTFYGFDFEYTMVRIGLMNMILHGIGHPNLTYADSLSKNFKQSKKYDIILANPPFAGSVDRGDINGDFKLDTVKTELLFLELFYNLLKQGGKAGVIVPTGILYGTSKSNKKMIKQLLEKTQLEAIIFMPEQVFRPYADILTSILIFTKGGNTDKIWVYEMENDGLSKSDKRKPIKENDIPDILKKFKTKESSNKSKIITVKEIIENDYDLTVLRQKEIKDKSTTDMKDVVEELSSLKSDIDKYEKILSKDLKKLGFSI